MQNIIFGIDGATFNILLPMVKQGLLPNISSYLNKGVYGKLHSVFPPITFPAWTSFKTGKNPAKHGVFDFLKDVPYMDNKPSKVSIADKRERSFFSLLSDYGYKVGVVNVPATYPPEKVNGIFISGFSTPSIEKEFVHPAILKQTLLSRFDYEFDIVERRIVGKEKEFLQKLTSTTKKITDAVCYLLQQDSYDFFMVNYMAVDQIQHFFYGYRDETHPLYSPEKACYGNKIEDIYSLIDNQIGTILSTVEEPVNVFFVSDHGFGPLEKVVYLNEWLRKEGFLYLNQKEESHLRIGSIIQQFVRNVVEHFPEGLIAFIPQFMKNRANDYVSWTQMIDWSKTIAYSGGYPGKIFINLKGREKEGIVQKGLDYDEVIKQIEQKAWKMKDPDTGEQIVSAIYHNTDMYEGRYFDIAPDLILIMKDMAYLNKPGFCNGNMFIPPPQGGDHRLHGIFIAGGPDIKHKEEAFKDLHICDIAPTVLHMYDVPLLSDFDGTVLKQIFVEDSKLYHKTIQSSEKDAERTMLYDTIKLLKMKKKF